MVGGGRECPGLSTIPLALCQQAGTVRIKAALKSHGLTKTKSQEISIPHSLKKKKVTL